MRLIVWNKLNNPDFKHVEFYGFINELGAMQWIK
jgi:hypothetical protein